MFPPIVGKKLKYLFYIKFCRCDKSKLHKHDGTGCTLFDNAGRTLS